MSSRLTVSCGGQSRTSQSTSQRRHRSRSTSRYADLDKPKKKKTLTATTSLVSIPNTIKLSMLNSGLLSFEKIKLEARDANNSLSQTIPDKPIELRNFTKLCEQRRKFPVLYKLEFQTAVKVETNTCRHATRKNNTEKNQNPKCIPYDYNRVVLEKIIGTPDSDYVNASYVDSLLKPNAYIVTQGPTEETANDFWRMIWQENVSAIVMLTKTFDFTKVMCVQYWPPNVEIHETYGDISINIVKEEQLANFHIRTFRLYKKNLEVVTDERFILQFHYTEWYSHTCPFSNAVLEFRRRVRAVVGNIIKPNSMVGPMLVHCNDGGGRSGVYLAIDANLELAEEEDCFHVFGYLKKLRQSRKGLIENVEQYKFVYDTLEEHVVCGKTWFPVTELSDRLKSKAKKDITTKMNEYQKEYAQICKQTPRFTIGDCAGGHRADNREKNRDVLCVPPDNFRPYLTSFQGNAFTDYINSVFVDGYTKPREYIVTEWPLKHTLGEFWSLVYDHECSAVVVLCQPPPNSQQYPSFWPQKSKMEKYGPVFSVHFVSGKHYQNIKQWEFKINKKIISLTEMMAGVKAPTKTVQLFQLTCWPMGHKVPTSTNSLVFLMNMVELWRQRTDYGPVCVVSPDGRSRAGVYCAANACIEQVIQHGEVDVFQAVKTVRRHRPQIIENMTEYKYCYDLVLHYVLHFLDKEHKEKKFIAFGRGKCIPLTPENQNMDLPSEISNTGRIVVNKYINKIDKREGIIQAEKEFLNRHAMDRSGKIAERKKGRLYSLGGNEPQRRAFRGRLDRLKTVGTFDLGTEMSVLSEVAINLNRQILSGEMGLLHPFTMSDQGIKTASVTSSTSLSVQNSKRNTPEVRKRELSASVRCDHNLFVRSPSHETKSNIEFKTQHSADDCIQRSIWANDKKFRSLSTSSYLDRDRYDVSLHQSTDRKSDIVPHSELLHMSAIDTKSNSPKSMRNYIDRESDKIEEDISSYEVFNKSDDSQRISLRNRKHMLRKSRRIIRTDSEVFSEGICEDSKEIVLKSNSEFQVHVNAEVPETSNEKLPLNERNSSVASSVFSRKDSSDIDDAFFRKIQKSTDDSSKNPSTDEIDAVFSDSTTDLERLEKEYKEIIKGNLQREYKSDGDTLDEIGKKRSEFGKWKNQSLEHEFELSNQELIILTGCQTLSSYSNETSGDVKDISRICSPESCTIDAYSDSGVRRSDNKHITYSKMRSRVYSSSRLGETPKEKERLLQDIPSEIDPLEHAPSAELCDYGLKNATSRPSMLEVKPEPQIKTSTESIKTSIFEKPFGRFRKVNKLLKCKRFSTSTLYDKKKTEENKASSSTKSKDSDKGKQNLEKRGSIHLSKLSLFSQKHGKGSIFSSRKLGMFSSSSRSTNELFSKESNKGKLSEISKSNTEISKSRISPSRFGSRKSSKNKKNSSTTNIHTNPMCHSPLSEEFYNKTGSVRLSAMELYEKFCSEDFGGLYKHEQFKGDERREGSYMNQHEYRLEKKGLRVIGRYNKNAMLFKQKSEPKFNFRPNTSSDYYQEEDEYYYNSANQSEYGYYNEQDEYYGEYEDEYGDEVEGDYYVDEEGDFYEDEVELIDSIGEARFGNEPRDVACALELDSQKELDILSMQRDIADDRKLLDVSMGCDSDVDEIYLMPEESKCPEYEKCGFENKQFTLEQSIIGRIGHRNISLDYLNDLRDYEPQKDPRVMKSIDSLSENRDSDVLTIYKICSRESVGRSFDLPENSIEQRAGIRSDSLQPAVLDYVKLTKSDTVIETSPITAEFPCIEKAESLELLSNSSGTARTHSTLTEYAFDTVKNLNLDSCSTSKLSLSLKSEVFDDFAITPDDLKPIQNCEFEDFTLTPDGSLSETYQKSGAISSVTTDDDKKDMTIEDEYKNKVVLIVDQFLINERKILSGQENEQPECSMIQKEQEHQLNTELENIEDQGQHCDADATTSEFTIIDLYDDEEQTISLFTSELTKEFDRLFSKAEEFEYSSSSQVVEESISRTEIPSRYSMQRLEPYLITDSSESTKSKPEDLTHILDVRASTQSRVSKSQLRKNRSKSLNNLNKKTKCFPL